MKRIVEIVCTSVRDCIDSARAGAGRIELCMTIEMGGLTPSAGLLENVKRSVPIPIMTMIRPRSGGFCYSETEFDTMLSDCDLLALSDGFVFGVLTADREIDAQRCKELVFACGKKEKVFHRAFDQLVDPIRSMELLIDLGFTRILTSGLAPSAEDGAGTIEMLIDAADGRIEIMPGGGVRPQNVQRILPTGCKSIHLAPLRESLDLSGGGTPYRVVDTEQVEQVVKLCNA